MKDRHARVSAICQECGSEFMARRTEVARGTGRGVLCSRKCVVKRAVRNYKIKRPRSSIGNPTKSDLQKAHDAIYFAVKSGKIKRPPVCEKCGVECKTHGHHEDYSKPLDVIWMCHKCHIHRHYEIGLQS